MKIYLFNPETGWYLGEDFADERGKSFVVPSDATTLPPPHAAPGELPVFDPLQKVWTVQQRSDLRIESPTAQAPHQLSY